MIKDPDTRSDRQELVGRAFDHTSEIYFTTKRVSCFTVSICETKYSDGSSTDIYEFTNIIARNVVNLPVTKLMFFCAKMPTIY